jgi:hypothetical protein
MKTGSKRGQSSNFRDSAPNKRPSVAPFEAPNDIQRFPAFALLLSFFALKLPLFVRKLLSKNTQSFRMP